MITSICSKISLPSKSLALSELRTIKRAMEASFVYSIPSLKITDKKESYEAQKDFYRFINYNGTFSYVLKDFHPHKKRSKSMEIKVRGNRSQLSICQARKKLYFATYNIIPLITLSVKIIEFSISNPDAQRARTVP